MFFFPTNCSKIALTFASIALMTGTMTSEANAFYPGGRGGKAEEGGDAGLSGRITYSEKTIGLTLSQLFSMDEWETLRLGNLMRNWGRKVAIEDFSDDLSGSIFVMYWKWPTRARRFIASMRKVTFRETREQMFAEHIGTVKGIIKRQKKLIEAMGEPKDFWEEQELKRERRKLENYETYLGGVERWADTPMEGLP